MMFILIGLVALLLGCAGYLLTAWLSIKANKEKEREQALYDDMCRQFKEMIGEVDDEVEIPYRTYKEMKRLVFKMRKAILKDN